MSQVHNEIRTKLTPQFEMILRRYLDDCTMRRLSPHTVGWYRDRVGYCLRFCQEEAGVKKIEDVTPDHLRDFINSMNQQGYAAKTVRHTVLGIRTFMKWCVDEDYIQHSPADRIKTPKVPRRLVQTFTDEQVGKLLEGCDRKTYIGLRNYAMLMVFLDTGVRVSEMIGIKLSDIDWSRRLIRVFGKGAKERLVPFGITLRAALEDYLHRRGDHENEEHLFLTHFAMPMDRSVVNAILRRHAKRVGVSGVRMSAHTFRHHFGKTWIMNGGDPFSLQAILGHTTQFMVSQYVNLALGDVQEQHAKFSPLDNLKTKPREKKIVLK